MDHISMCGAGPEEQRGHGPEEQRGHGPHYHVWSWATVAAWSLDHISMCGAGPH